ncbi:MAG TPA: hypothetical protein ENH62_02220 [Marinobacter sp.]|uniref:LamG-like jellyroll fold domain-containing protein n=1 Tax=marine sediment metagenome TaxID=412755 RepID=A0A0F9QL51_9ZZZZ|nr:hypothetical protein [Marinobacter sp.]HEC61435.1 hypothetical protein [bacterium]
MGFLRLGRRKVLLGSMGDYSTKVMAQTPIAYWPMWEAAGSVAADISGNGFDGVFAGVTLGQVGIGDGNTCPFFDGANDKMNAYSTGFRDAFNGAEGSIVAWAKMNAGTVWEDGVSRYIFRFLVNGSNEIRMYKSTANNRIDVNYKAGGTGHVRSLTALTTVEWMNIAITWSKIADQVKVYLDGVQNGATLTGLGTWAGTFSSSQTVVGARIVTPSDVWHGYLAHFSVFGSPLASEVVADLAVV